MPTTFVVVPADWAGMELKTERLVLREFAADDFDAVHAFASDPDVVEFMDWGPNSPEETRQGLAAFTRDQDANPRTRYNLAITELDGPPFGTIGLTRQGYHHGEMGFVFARDRWGQGFASEAAAAVLEFAFADLGLHRVQATCRPENIASSRALEKIGMVREGYLREHILIRGSWRDSLLYAAVATGR